MKNFPYKITLRRYNLLALVFILVGIAIVVIALILFILWARKLGVMKEIVPTPYQMEHKKDKKK